MEEIYSEAGGESNGNEPLADGFRALLKRLSTERRLETDGEENVE